MSEEQSKREYFNYIDEERRKREFHLFVSAEKQMDAKESSDVDLKPVAQATRFDETDSKSELDKERIEKEAEEIRNRMKRPTPVKLHLDLKQDDELAKQMRAISAYIIWKGMQHKEPERGDMAYISQFCSFLAGEEGSTGRRVQGAGQTEVISSSKSNDIDSVNFREIPSDKQSERDFKDAFGELVDIFLGQGKLEEICQFIESESSIRTDYRNMQLSMWLRQTDTSLKDRFIAMADHRTLARQFLIMCQSWIWKEENDKQHKTLTLPDVALKARKCFDLCERLTEQISSQPMIETD